MKIIGIIFQILTSYLKLSKDYDHFFKNSYLHKINIYNIFPKKFSQIVNSQSETHKQPLFVKTKIIKNFCRKKYVQFKKGLPPYEKNFFKISPFTGRDSLLPVRSWRMNVFELIFSTI